MFGSFAAWTPGPMQGGGNAVSEVRSPDAASGTVAQVPGLREDDVRDSDAPVSKYVGYCLSDGAVVHKKCRAKYQRGFSSVDTANFPRTVTAIERGDLHASMPCSHCSKPIAKCVGVKTNSVG